MTLSELLTLRRAIEMELLYEATAIQSRLSRVSVVERVVADAYRGTLAPVGTKPIDVISDEGRRIQVKARSLPKGDLRHWALADFDFDFDAIVLIAIDRETAIIDWARKRLPGIELRGNPVDLLHEEVQTASDLHVAKEIGNGRVHSRWAVRRR